MYKRQLSYFVIFWALLTFLGTAKASPTKRLSRMVREVYPEIDPENEGNQAQVCIVGDLVYGAEESVPAEQPCLKCKCQPPGVQCETIQCVKRPGCKAIHKSNKCCPDYQCECEHNGKFYANGEKLETSPGGECKVCYCRGGEVQCAEVSCYIRKDCEGKRVPGKCCPKYDHCPPIDAVSGRSPYTTEINAPIIDKESFDPWPVTRLTPNVTEDILNPTSIDIQDENKIPDTNYYEVTTASYKLTEIEDLQKEAFLPRITIQEIIPERREIPITAPPKTDLEPQGTLVIEEAEEFLNHSNDLVVTDADADSSEISEVFQHPPPILRIGDKLLFLKKGELVPEKDTSTPNSVITIIGAEGLQRGGFEDSGEVHEVRIDSISTENEGSINATNLPTKPDELSLDNSLISNPDQSLDPNSNISELNTAASTHILSLVKRKNKPSTTTTTTETYTTISLSESDDVSSTTETNVLQDAPSSISTTVQEVLNDTNTTTESNDLAKTTIDALDTLTTEDVKNISEVTTAAEVENNTEKKESTTIPSSTKSYDVVLEQNPAYPPIPDIMADNTDDTVQKFYMENTEKEQVEPSTATPNLKILTEVLEMRSNKTVPQNITHSEWLKVNPESLLNYEAALPNDLLIQSAPTDMEDATETSSEAEVTLPNTTTQTFTTDKDEDINEAPTETVTDYIKQFEDILAITTTDIPINDEDVRSTESIEESSEEIIETTTKKSSHASITTNENASIENINDDSSEAGDMSSTGDAANDTSGEQTTPSILSDPGTIDKEWKDSNKNSSNENNKDVELVDAVKTTKQVIERNVHTTAPLESLPKPEKLTLPSKMISKRETNYKEDLDDIFKQLKKEISSETTERSISSEEEDRESKEIFQQLLEETSTLRPRPERKGGLSETIQQSVRNTGLLEFPNRKLFMPRL